MTEQLESISKVDEEKQVFNELVEELNSLKVWQKENTILLKEKDLEVEEIKRKLVHKDQENIDLQQQLRENLSKLEMTELRLSQLRAAAELNEESDEKGGPQHQNKVNLNQRSSNKIST